jgi:hypothetical protein
MSEEINLPVGDLIRPRGISHIRHILKARTARRLGGIRAHQKKNKTERCHEFSSDEARAAANKRWGKC